MEYDIKDVALYLRKSRGEEEKDLHKHRSILTDLAKKNNWRYIEYFEIANSETIEFRPKFKQLLKDIEDNMFDAVAVVDYDRLGRGDLEEQAIVKRVFRDSETFIITPEKIYNLIDDSDDLMVDVKGLIARQEYKAIKKRLARGKKIGARQGNWTNGKPPFPYIYEPSRKGLVVDQSKLETYNTMKKMLLSGESFQKIAWYLNTLKIPSPKNSFWHENTIRRIVTDETHIGRIITNKTEGSGHKNKKTKELKYFDRDEWNVIENCHEITKTQEEHNEILTRVRVRNKFHPAARRGAFVLSGLLSCGICGKTMQMQGKGIKEDLVKPCRKADPVGNRCDNKGNKLSTVLEALKHSLKEESLRLSINEDSVSHNSMDYEKLIKLSNDKLQKCNVAISRIKDLYEEGEYDKDEYHKRLSKRKAELNKIESEMVDYTLLLEKQNDLTNSEKSKKINSVIDILDDADVDTETKNAMLKEIIDRVIYLKNSINDIPTIECLYK